MFKDRVVVCFDNPAGITKYLNFLSFPPWPHLNSLSLVIWLYFHDKALFLVLKRYK
jgi:hypothetical protein